jgi:hypothetical protein
MSSSDSERRAYAIGLRHECLAEQRDVKRDAIPSGLDENVTPTQGSSVTRNPALRD